MTATLAPLRPPTPLRAPRFHEPTNAQHGWPDDPEQTRVMIIAPGPMFSTKDVYDSAVSGMQANGVQVLALDYHTDLNVMAGLERLRKTEGDNPDDQSFREFTLYASHRAVARALVFQPHLVLVISGTVFPPPVAGLLGQYTPTAVWLTESPYQRLQEEYAQGFYRQVFTNERTYVERLRAIRVEQEHPRPDLVHYLPHCFDRTRHYPRPVEDAYASDVCFIGSPFPERKTLFDGVNWDGISTKLIGVYADIDLEETMVGPNGGVPNDEAQRYYASATININHHRITRYYGRDETITDGEAESINPRTYELAAAGVFQVCDDSRAELRDLFGDSVPTYRHGESASLERLVRYYLSHPRERAACAAAAYRRVQRHTAQARMQQVLDVCLGDQAVTRKAVHAAQ